MIVTVVASQSCSLLLRSSTYSRYDNFYDTKSLYIWILIYLHFATLYSKLLPQLIEFIEIFTMAKVPNSVSQTQPVYHQSIGFRTVHAQPYHQLRNGLPVASNQSSAANEHHHASLCRYCLLYELVEGLRG